MNDSNFAVINTTQGEDNFYLYNYDKLYKIAKSWKLENEVSIGDSLFVVDLAKSNAYYTGPATFIARAMLGEYGEDEFINFNRILNFNKTENKGLKVSPNPTNGNVKITFGKPTNQMELRNFMGQLVKFYSINNLEYIEIDINDLADGIYFINADNKANGIKLVKIAK